MFKRFFVAIACVAIATVPSPLWAMDIGDIEATATTLPLNQTLTVTGYVTTVVNECPNGSGGAFGALERGGTMSYFDPSMVTFEHVGYVEQPDMWQDDDGIWHSAMINKWSFTADFVSDTTSTWDIIIINCGDEQMAAGVPEFSWVEN